MVKVEQFRNRSGDPVKNQLIIITEEGVFFQSYNSIIAFVAADSGAVTLDASKWDYSVTTGKYRNQFLMETKTETEKKIKTGVYTLADLNKNGGAI